MRRVLLVLGAAFLAGGVSLSTVSAEPIGGAQLAGKNLVVAPSATAQKFPKVMTETFVLADAKTGAILAAKGAHVRRPPASTLKMLTALTILPRLSLDTTYRAKPSDAFSIGSRVGLTVGRTYTINDLMYGLFLPSGNDAAMALAHANGGKKKTLAEMNLEAKRLQALDTFAKNPSGLDTPGQLSSAYDLALIGRAGIERKDFRTFTKTKVYDFPNGKNKKGEAITRPIYNTNRLLQSGYRGVIGVKTGYTTNAGRTFVAAAKRNGTTLIVSLMGINEASESAARKLLTWGFDNYDQLTPVGTLVSPKDSDSKAFVAAAIEQGDVETAALVPTVDTTPDEGVAWVQWIVLAAGILTIVVLSLWWYGSQRVSRGKHA